MKKVVSLEQPQCFESNNIVSYTTKLGLLGGATVGFSFSSVLLAGIAEEPSIMVFDNMEVPVIWISALSGGWISLISRSDIKKTSMIITGAILAGIITLELESWLLGDAPEDPIGYKSHGKAIGSLGTTVIMDSIIGMSSLAGSLFASNKNGLSRFGAVFGTIFGSIITRIKTNYHPFEFGAYLSTYIIQGLIVVPISFLGAGIGFRIGLCLKKAYRWYSSLNSTVPQNFPLWKRLLVNTTIVQLCYSLGSLYT